MQKQSRRSMLKNMAMGASAIAISPGGALASCSSEKNETLKGYINHSVCQWTYNFLSLDELCKVVKNIGFSAIDLIKPSDWPILQQHGIYCSMCYTQGENNLYKGLNNPAYHSQLIKEYLEVIPLMKKAGYKNLICFSGARDGIDEKPECKIV